MRLSERKEIKKKISEQKFGQESVKYFSCAAIFKYDTAAVFWLAVSQLCTNRTELSSYYWHVTAHLQSFTSPSYIALFLLRMQWNFKSNKQPYGLTRDADQADKHIKALPFWPTSGLDGLRRWISVLSPREAEPWTCWTGRKHRYKLLFGKKAKGSMSHVEAPRSGDYVADCPAIVWYNSTAAQQASIFFFLTPNTKAEANTFFFVFLLKKENVM